MAYSFPVFRKGLVFKTVRLVSADEAKRIVARIRDEGEVYNSAFASALARNNGSIVWEEEKSHDAEVQQYIKESYIFNFRPMRFRYNGFSIQARNSVTVCRHEHRSKVWTRLSCTEAGDGKKDLSVDDVRRFFDFAHANADHILKALADTYQKHLKDAGIEIPNTDKYFFQLRAFNTTSIKSLELLNELQSGLALYEALDDKRFQTELVDFFEIALGKRIKPKGIKRSVKARTINVFGYNSEDHEALFTARVTPTQTDVCGYGYDDKRDFTKNMFSHSATKDLLKEYAQNF